MKDSIVKKPFIIVVVLIHLFVPTQLFAEWTYSFVVYNDNTYVISDEYTTTVDKIIGHVTKYSNRAGTYYGNFSNTYKKGTKYYSIKDIDIEEAIAIEDNGKYRIAFYNGEYKGWKYSPFQIAIGGLVIVLISVLLLKVRRRFTST